MGPQEGTRMPETTAATTVLEHQSGSVYNCPVCQPDLALADVQATAVAERTAPARLSPVGA